MTWFPVREIVLSVLVIHISATVTKTIFGAKTRILGIGLNYWILEPVWSILRSSHHFRRSCFFSVEGCLNLQQYFEFGFGSTEVFCLTEWTSSDASFTSYVSWHFFLQLFSPKRYTFKQLIKLSFKWYMIWLYLNFYTKSQFSTGLTFFSKLF